jgi:hypothetical protein
MGKMKVSVELPDWIADLFCELAKKKEMPPNELLAKIIEQTVYAFAAEKTERKR